MDSPPMDAAALAAARDAVKAHLRIADGAGGEDALIARHAASALALCEAFTGTATILRGWTGILPAAPGWQRLAGAPVRAILAVEGLPAEGSAFALPAHAYAIDIDGAGDGWVRVPIPGAAGRVRVTYQAGLAADWEALPAPIAQGVVLLAAHLFEARGGALPPAAVAALWRPWRRLRLAGAARCAG